jgi:hypothetical protein
VPRTPPGRAAVSIALVTFAIVFAGLAIFSYTRQSATFDEPGHLAAGYAALARSDFRVDIEHPPLARMWAAIPLLAIRVDDSALRTIDAAAPNAVAFAGPFELAHRFLYRDNDADALLYRARFMIVLLGVLLGVLVFAWTMEWLGWRAALISLLLFVAEPNIAAHSALVTTDLGVACFIFGSLYFAWRASRSWSSLNVALLVMFAICAALTKFSGLVTLPLVSVLLLFCWFRRRLPLPRVLTAIALVAGAMFLAGWAAYGFRFAPSPKPDWLFTLHQSESALLAIPTTAGIIAWIDAHRLLPNALAEGFLHSQGPGRGTSRVSVRRVQPVRLVVLLPCRDRVEDTCHAALSVCRRHCRAAQATGALRSRSRGVRRRPDPGLSPRSDGRLAEHRRASRAAGVSVHDCHRRGRRRNDSRFVPDPDRAHRGRGRTQRGARVRLGLSIHVGVLQRAGRRTPQRLSRAR